MKMYKWIIVVVLNLAIAIGFYVEGTNASVSHISSDLANIIPVCLKLDNPELFQNDLYLNDINNVKYYTPAFVELLRLSAKLFDGNYLLGLNLLGATTHLVYGILWFLFFYTLKKDFWLALLFSLFFRGILWPPGGELFGISDLWTIMPRTIFISLAPIPLLLYFYLKKYRIFLAAISLGLILNFHPISGVGLAACYFAFYFYYSIFYSDQNSKAIWIEFFLAAFGFLLGMLPYLLVYFLNVKGAAFDENLYDLAFHKRLGYIFSDPVLFIAQWDRPILYFFGLLFLLFYFFDSSKSKSVFKSLAFTVIFVFFAANISVYLESLINSLLGLNLRLSFQLIRFQKFIIILFQIGTYLLLFEVFRKFSISARIKQSLLLLFLILCSLSFVFPFSKIPIVGDDLMQSILPKSFMVEPRIDYGGNSSLPELISYIKNNTEKDAVFYGSFYIRTGAERSVVLDGKGSSMIIEGNQAAFINWYLQTEKLKNLENASDKAAYLKSLGVNYIVSDQNWPLELVISKGNQHLYKL